ncbi:MAG TPA: acyltransferase [Flavipsychrobacter sp.]|nr:acyltransferase [Flavipsychrobacter sp.]
MQLNQLTFTRFLAAISIVVFHYGMASPPFNFSIFSTLFSHANIGVSYFFILSGFVMVIAYSAKRVKINIKEYYVNRFARIYPVYFLALLITALLIIVKLGEFDIIEFALSSSLIQGWFPQYATSLNGPGWSLSVEMFFYVLFPFLFNLGYSTKNLKSISICVLAFWLISQVVFNSLFYSPFYKGYPSFSHSFLHYFPAMHLSEFMIGNLTGLFFLRYRKNKNFDLSIVFLMILIPLTIILTEHFKVKLNFHNGLMAYIFVPLILLLSMNTGRITTLFSHKFCILLGEISYGVYILQYPIFLVVRYFSKYIPHTHPSVVFYFYLLMLFGTSLLSYYLIELPARKRIKSVMEKKINKKKEIKAYA